MTYASPLPHDLGNSPRIVVEGLQFAYEQSPIFGGLTLDIEAPLILLEGPSGCGKTTFLKLLAGILSPTVAGSLLHPKPVRIILQEDALFPWLTVEGNLACVPEWKGLQNCPLAVHPLVPLITPLFKKYVHTLSFGQRRIVELFRILCFATPLVCLDEPFNFLDPAKRATVAAVIENMANQGICFIISSHYREDFKSWNGAVYRFDGSLPVRSLEQISTK